MATKKIVITRKEWEKAGRLAQWMPTPGVRDANGSNGLELAAQIVGMPIENLGMWTIVELATAWTKLDETHLPNEEANESLAEPVSLIGKEISRRFRNC